MSNYIIENLRHRCYEFESSGVLLYNPCRKGREDPLTIVIEVEEEIGEYYRFLFNKALNIKLLKPSWSAHISITRGIESDLDFVNYWKSKTGQRVKFLYTHELFWNKNHVWLNTYCEEISKYREKYHINHKVNEALGHITIGKFQQNNYVREFKSYKDNFYK